MRPLVPNESLMQPLVPKQVLYVLGLVVCWDPFDPWVLVVTIRPLYPTMTHGV